MTNPIASPHKNPPLMFVNLLVKDIPRSMKFFTDLGYHFNLQFTGPESACLVFSEQNFCMLLTENFFRTMFKDANTDKSPGTGWIAFSCASRAEVDEIVARAFSLGAKRIRPPQDLGFMYSDGFEDPDGNVWHYHWMDPAHIEK